MGKRYNKQGEEIETRREVFMRNYKNVPGFKAVVKLGGYLLFILIFVVIAVITNYDKKEKETNKKANATPVTTTISITSFGDMLTNISKVGSENTISIKYQEKEYLISTTIKDSGIEGYYEDGKINTKFIIKENKVYEIKMNNEIQNDELLQFFDIDFINNLSLIEILKNTNSTKTLIDNGYEYDFDINKDDMDSYKLKVITDNNKINKIEINNDIINYSITIE